MSGPLWASDDAVKATGGTSTGDWIATGISIDTRTLQPGDLFVALQGPHFDGHEFVADAFEKGAAAAIVSKKMQGAGPLLIVSDTLQALRDLAAFSRTRSKAKIIALTGSVGKTGTKEALRHALSFQGKTHASAASLNNHWGAPLSLALLPPDADYAIFELGMNHPGEIEPLSKLVRPHIAIVLNVEAVHLGPMGSLAAIAHAKAEIFAGLGNDGISILNKASNGIEIQTAQAKGKQLFFGAPDSDATIETLLTDAQGSDVIANILGARYSYRIPHPGAHLAINSLAVLLAVHAVGGDVSQTAKTYINMPALNRRGDKSTVAIPGGHITLIDETHNASPIAVRAALKVLAMMPGGRRIAVLGDMLELGPDSPRLHAELAPDIAAAGVKLAFLSGSNMAHLFAALPPDLRGGHAGDSTSLLPLLQPALRDGDIVLVKGSRGSNMKVIVEALKGTHAI